MFVCEWILSQSQFSQLKIGKRGFGWISLPRRENIFFLSFFFFKFNCLRSFFCSVRKIE
jgi:hypothetical protein